MGKHITVGEGYTEKVKTDHRNGKQTVVQDNVEVRPVMEGYHNETVRDRYNFGRDFITMFTEDLFDLVVDGKMSLREWRVFLLLCATMNTKNITITNLDVIAETLKLPMGQETHIDTLSIKHPQLKGRLVRNQLAHQSEIPPFRLREGLVIRLFHLIQYRIVSHKYLLTIY